MPSLRLDDAVVWMDDPELDLTSPFQGRLSRPTDGRVWWTNSTRARDGVLLMWMSVDGSDGGAAVVAEDHPLIPSAAACGAHVAVVSVKNVPHLTSVLSVYVWSADQPRLIAQLPLAHHDYLVNNQVVRVVSSGSPNGSFYVLDRAEDPDVPAWLLRRVSIADGALVVRSYRLAAPVMPDGQLAEVDGIDVCEPSEPGPAFVFYVVFSGGRLVRYRGPDILGLPASEGTLLAEDAPAELVVTGPWSIDGDGSLWLGTQEEPATLSVRPWPISEVMEDAVSVSLADFPGRTAAAGFLCVGMTTIVARRIGDPVELARCYLHAGWRQLQLVIPCTPPTLRACCDVLSVTLGDSLTVPSGAPWWWPAGAAVELEVETMRYHRVLAGPMQPPQLRAWAFPWGTAQAMQWSISGTATRALVLQVPADAVGLYRLCLTTDVQAPGASPYDSPYAVETIIEIRPSVTAGAWVWPVTTDGPYPDGSRQPRTIYWRGETIRFDLLGNSGTALPETTVELLDASGVLGRFTTATGEAGPYALPAALTGALPPGSYRLRLLLPDGLNTLDQPFEISDGGRSGFLFIEHGDQISVTALNYDVMPMIPVSADVMPYRQQLLGTIAPERIVAAAAARAHRSAARGTTLIIERVSASNLTPPAIDPTSRLAAIPAHVLSMPAERTTVPPYLGEVVTRLGALGVSYMGIGTENDSQLAAAPSGQILLLPITEANPNPVADQTAAVTASLQSVTRTLQTKASFRGWVWAGNWWTLGIQTDLNLAENAGYAPTLQAQLAASVAEVSTTLVTAAPGPFRNPCAWPPLTFADIPGAALQPVQEVDLHGQPEQVDWPFRSAFEVDFYRRPGKRVLAHPQILTDRGTGEQLLPALLLTLARGAGAIGAETPTPPNGIREDDPRLSYPGYASTSRALAHLLDSYGSWWAGLHQDDQVAILARRATFRSDKWSGISLPAHFAKVFFAYTCCLYSQHSARIIVDDDLLAGQVSLDGIKVLLLVDEQLPLEAPLRDLLLAALGRQTADGPLTVLCDGGCSAQVAAEFGQVERPDGTVVSFTGFEDLSTRSDHEYWTARDAVAASVAALRPILDATLGVGPAAEVPESGAPGPTVHVRSALQGRYILIVDDTPIPLLPAQLWRTTLACASRLPSVAVVDLKAGPSDVAYDVFAGEQVRNGVTPIPADLRHLPSRLFAVLPAAIDHVQLRGPTQLQAGQEFTVAVLVVDQTGQPIPASVPVRITMEHPDARVLEVHVLDCRGSEQTVSLTAPLQTTAVRLRVRAVELFSGNSCELRVLAAALPQPVDLDSAEPLPSPITDLSSAVEAGQAAPWSGTRPAATRFGPRVRDCDVTTDERLAASPPQTGVTTSTG